MKTINSSARISVSGYSKDILFSQIVAMILRASCLSTGVGCICHEHCYQLFHWAVRPYWLFDRLFLHRFCLQFYRTLNARWIVGLKFCSRSKVPIALSSFLSTFLCSITLRVLVTWRQRDFLFIYPVTRKHKFITLQTCFGRVGRLAVFLQA